MSEEQPSYGELTIKNPEGGQRTVQITEYIKAEFKDQRLVGIAKSEENTYVLSVENPESSGRHSVSKMHLTEESFIGLYAAINMYMMSKGDPQHLVKKAMSGDLINFSTTPNLKESLDILQVDAKTKE